MSYKLINAKTIRDDDPVRCNHMIGFFNDLDRFMSERHNYKRSKCRPYINKVDARCEKFSLTLSYMHDNSAAITAICFKRKRRGHCAALVNFIDGVSSEYHIPNIEFISVMTDSMKAFLIKNGFTNREAYYCPVEAGIVKSKNWYRPTPYGLANPKLGKRGSKLPSVN